MFGCEKPAAGGFFFEFGCPKPFKNRYLQTGNFKKNPPAAGVFGEWLHYFALHTDLAQLCM